MSFLIRSQLSKDDLRLFLTNQDGYPQDASITWTIYAHDGSQVSGRKLPAIREKTGEYYAPFYANLSNGNYSIKWSIRDDRGVHREEIEQFFIVDPSSYQCCPTKICKDGKPADGGGTYLSGTTLKRGDLPLFLKNREGFSYDAYAVFWSVHDITGRQIVCKTNATRVAQGEYFACWYVNVCSGDYTIKWEWMENEFSPLQSKSQKFSIISASNPFVPSVAILCHGNKITYAGCDGIAKLLVIGSTGCAPQKICSTPIIISQQCIGTIPDSPCIPTKPDAIMIPRTVHLSLQVLPVLGTYTNQDKYLIPHGVKDITFFVTYKRGVSGGFPKLRLIWGNGTEEAQETLIDGGETITPDLETSQNLSSLSLNGPKPQSDNPITFIIEANKPGGVTTARLIAAEGGAVGSPGTISITLTASN